MSKSYKRQKYDSDAYRKTLKKQMQKLKENDYEHEIYESSKGIHPFDERRRN